MADFTSAWASSTTDAADGEQENAFAWMGPRL
jgi:hypothetical protein